MITINTNDAVKDREGFFVAAPTGDYNEVDLLECYHEDNPTLAICMLQAQYIKFGDVVYQQNEPLNSFQIDAMLQGVAGEDVINNEDLMKKEAGDPERSGKIVGKRGLIKEAEAATPIEDVVTIDDYKNSLLSKKPLNKLDNTVTTTPDTSTTPSVTPNTATSTEPYFAPATETSTPTPDTSTTTLPITPEEIPVISTTTPTVEVPLVPTTSTTTQVIDIPTIPSTSTTTEILTN